MKKILKVLLFSSLMFGSLVGCDKDNTNSTPDNQQSNTTNNVAAPKVTGITLDTKAVKKEYNYGDSLNLSGLVVTANYDNETSKAVTDYKSDPSNGSKLNTLGDVAVTITYEGKSSSFNIAVNKVMTGITLDTTNVKKDYVYKDKLDLTGLVVKADYNDDSSVTVTDYTVSPSDQSLLTEGGENSITVSYNGFNKSFRVMVDKAVKSIELDTTNAKTEYNYGDKFTSSGLVVKGVYANGVKEVIDSGLYFGIQEETELFETGEKEVTVSFGSLSSSYKINVVKNPSSITANANAVKQNYKIGDKLDLTGLVVTATYPSGATEEVTEYTTNIANNSDLNTAGKFDLVVTYLNKTDSFEINVIKTAVDVTFNPDNAKLYYHYGDQLDLTGLVVTVTYDDGSREITSNYSQSIANGTALKTTEGTEDIIIAYGKFTYTVTIEVDVGSCWLNTAQMKTVYNYGEALNTDGLRAFVRFGDGETEDLVIKGTKPENGTIVDTIDQYFYVVATYVDNTGRDQGGMLALPVRFADETGTHGSVDLSLELSFSGDSAPRKAIGTRGSNFRPVFYFKPTTLMGSIFDSNMQRTIFRKDYELYNYDSIGGITSIRVNGGEDNYDLYVGYTKENMYKFLESTADGDSRIYSNIPNVNYMKIVGKSNEQPAYISSVEFDYTRDANHQMVEGSASVNPLSATGSFVGVSKNVTLDKTSLTIGTSTFTYTGIVYKNSPLYVGDEGNTVLSINDTGTNYIVITDLTNSINSEYANTYYQFMDASHISMYVDNVEVSENTSTERRTIQEGESFNFSATCDAVPAEIVSITVVGESFNNNPDNFCGTYTIMEPIKFHDINRTISDFDLTIDPINIGKYDGKYYALYVDYSTEGYPGHCEMYECTFDENYVYFGDENLSMRLSIDGNYDYQYRNSVGADPVMCNAIGFCKVNLSTKPIATYSNGKVEVTNGGDFYIECTTSNNLVSRLYYRSIPYVPAEITLHDLGIYVPVGESKPLSYELTSGATNPAVTFESSDTNVATISDDGIITGISKGHTIITINTVDDSKTINLYVGTSGNINSIRYKFTDDGNNEHILTLFNEAYIVIDGTYIFNYSEGLYSAEYDGKSTLLELAFNGSGLYLDFVDEAGIFASSGPIVTNTSSAYKLTLIEDTISSASTGQSGSEIAIGIGGQQTYKKYYFDFWDTLGIRHTVEYKEGIEIILDGTFIFKLSENERHICVCYIGRLAYVMEISIDLHDSKLYFLDPKGVIFSQDGHVKTNNRKGNICLYTTGPNN